MTINDALNLTKDLFSDRIDMMVRCNLPEHLGAEDTLYDYYVVTHVGDSFEIESKEDKVYLDDPISKFEYGADYFPNGLVVWLNGIVWSN